MMDVRCYDDVLLPPDASHNLATFPSDPPRTTLSHDQHRLCAVTVNYCTRMPASAQENTRRPRRQVSPGHRSPTSCSARPEGRPLHRFPHPVQEQEDGEALPLRGALGHGDDDAHRPRRGRGVIPGELARRERGGGGERAGAQRARRGAPRQVGGRRAETRPATLAATTGDGHEQRRPGEPGDEGEAPSETREHALAPILERAHEREDVLVAPLRADAERRTEGGAARAQEGVGLELVGQG